MITVNDKKLCEACFAEVDSDTCAECGFRKKDIRSDNTVLSMGSVLEDRYLIGKVIGKGGFGITYLAYDMKLRCRVAIKEYFPYGVAVRDNDMTTVSVSSEDSASTFREGADKFYEEARLVAGFNGNPNIVSVYDFFYGNDTVYFTMGYLQGITLKKYIADKGILSTSKAIRLADDICKALMAAHSENVLHRDISPDNIMVCYDGTIKLLDFGAARQVFTDESRSLSVILKQGFAPLEQYQKRGKQGPWTDIYSLGATIYHSLTGDVIDDPMSRLDDDNEFVSNRHGIHEGLWKIIVKATMLKPKERYQDVFELKEDLDGLNIAPEALINVDYRTKTRKSMTRQSNTESVPASVNAVISKKETRDNSIGVTMPAKEEETDKIGVTMPAKEEETDKIGVTMPAKEEETDKIGITMPAKEAVDDRIGVTIPAKEIAEDKIGITMPVSKQAVSVEAAHSLGKKKTGIIIGGIAGLAVLTAGIAAISGLSADNGTNEGGEIVTDETEETVAAEETAITTEAVITTEAAETIDTAETNTEEKLFMYSENNGSITIDKYYGTEKNLVIPAEIDGVPVTAVGASAFAGNTDIVTLTIPSGIKKIGMRAFSNCDNLEEVVIVEGVEIIENDAFNDCASLEKINVPKSVKEIGNCAFANCPKLVSVTISEGSKMLGTNMFFNCDSLEKVILPDSVELISVGAFADCDSLTLVSVPAEAQFGMDAFYSSDSVEVVRRKSTTAETTTAITTATETSAVTASSAASTTAAATAGTSAATTTRPPATTTTGQITTTTKTTTTTTTAKVTTTTTEADVTQVKNKEYTLVVDYDTGKKYTGKYTGGWKNGKPEGEGKFVASDVVNLAGEKYKYTYEGKWSKGERNGKGKETADLASGDVVVNEGTFENGVSQGDATQKKTFKNGDVYTAKVRMADGHFTYIYEVIWKFSDGGTEKYKGEAAYFEEDATTYYHGDGYYEYTFPDGSLYVFEGEFNKAISVEGVEAYTDNSGYTYAFEGKYDKNGWWSTGKLVEKYENGVVVTYEGGFQYNESSGTTQFSGHGYYTWSDGSYTCIYEGQFANGAQNGQGRQEQIYSDGTKKVYEGQFAYGDIYDGTVYEYNSSGSLISSGEIVDGVIP